MSRTLREHVKTICKQKLLECIRNFDFSKTQENRKKVFDARKDYKYYCRKYKQNFNRYRCIQMNEMRREKTKNFGKFPNRIKWSKKN